MRLLIVLAAYVGGVLLIAAGTEVATRLGSGSDEAARDRPEQREQAEPRRDRSRKPPEQEPPSPKAGKDTRGAR